MYQFENTPVINHKIFKSLLFLAMVLLLGSESFAQSLNNYKYLVMSKRYSFQDVTNEYRLNSNARFILAEQGFQVLLDDEVLPEELAQDRCKAMYLDIANPDGFMVTKLSVTFKDCQNKVLFATDGVSKEKSKKEAYNEALTMALNSVKTLKYKYNGEESVAKTAEVTQTTAPEKVLTAKAITNGFQLLDSQSNTVMTILKTSNKDCFLATKNNLHGVLILKDYQWFFEYYQDNQFFSEKVKVVF